MTPTEVAAKLRAFNDWRRGDEDIPQFDPRAIGDAIDAAIEMIEQVGRVEAAAKDLVRMKGRHNTEIAYMRLVAALEESKVDINELRQSAQAATPGPWYIGSGTYEGRNIYSVEAVTDDEGFTYNPVVATAEDDEVACWDANARLIAAAPDLLEALQWYEAKAVQMGRAAIHQDSKLMLALMKEIAVEYGAKARAAIARATGEQP